ncbi:MAG: glutamate--tRNA ligase family protein [Candidatus Angelobacter sp.]
MARSSSYRGRLAPSPTGYLHLGHARTFWVAWQRARAANGKLIFRNEDLDYQRCKPEFVRAMYEDLHWLGLDWDEGPDISFQSGKSGQPVRPDLGGVVSHGDSGRGSFGPYSQSERRSFYLDAWRKLRDSGLIYPCTCSRKDLERALSAPHEETSPGAEFHHLNDCGPQAASPAIAKDPSSQPGAAAVLFLTEGPSSQSATVQTPPDDELPYPGTCREKIGTARDYDSPAGVSWRFKVPDNETISFADGYFGRREFVTGRDFADFLLWRRDDIPSYQLAVVVDDAAMQIREVVRGADLLKSTARQMLLISALGYRVPAYFHCPLLRDEKNVRLAKRHDALSLRNLREQRADRKVLRKKFADELKWDRGLVKP